MEGRLFQCGIIVLAGYCAASGSARADNSASGTATVAPPVAPSSLTQSWRTSEPPSIWPNLAAETAPWLQRFADGGCTVDPSKTHGSRSPSSATQSPSGCPIDPTKVGGAQEHPTNGPVEDQHILYSEYNFASPIYQTLEGQLFSSTRASFKSSESDTFASGVKTGTKRVSQLQFSQVERYGITDDLSVRIDVSADEFVNNITTTSTNGSKKTTHGDEWNDPQFDVIYRVLAQPDAPVYFDISGQYTPNIISPNQIFSLEETVGRVFDDLTLEAAVTTTYASEGHIGSKLAPAYWSNKILLESFYNLSDRWSVNGNVTYQINPGKGGDGLFNLQAQANYFIIPETFQVTLAYSHFLRRDTGSNRNYDENFVGIEFNYLSDTGISSKK